MIYANWVLEWLSNYVKPTSKQRTFERYSQIVNVHVLDALGDFELKDITPMVLQKFISGLLESGNKKTGKPLSANFVNCIISVVQSSLKVANMLGLVECYHAGKIVRPKIVEKEVESFSLQEQKQIEQFVLASKRKKLFGIVICLYTGLRIGELLALEWSDIDFDKGILSVTKTAFDKRVDGETKRIIDTPKTANSRRIIPLPKQLLPIIKEMKKEAQSNWVIVDKNGKPVSVRSYQRSFELLLNRLKIEHKGFHALRHTFATRALECGMDVKSLSEILGHKNSNVTLNRYVHSFIEHKKEMMNRLGKLL